LLAFLPDAWQIAAPAKAHGLITLLRRAFLLRLDFHNFAHTTAKPRPALRDSYGFDNQLVVV
jgi:hypothetical protein